MRILLALFYLNFASMVGVSQTACDYSFEEGSEALLKYKNTRNSFNKHFIKSSLDEDGMLLNDGIGEWNPAKLRYEYAGYNLPASFLYMTYRPLPYDCHNDEKAGTPNTLTWGDSPIGLGKFIATICTEYALLSIDGKEELKQQKIRELFLALQAYRRLDMTANRVWAKYLTFFDCTFHAGDPDVSGITASWTGYEPDLSGYSGWFFREDVPSNFYNVISNNDYPEEWKVGGIKSDYACEMDDPFFSHFRLNVPSIDQVTGVLFGLAFVKKYIPEDAKVSIDGQEYYPLQMARDIAAGMVNRIHGDKNKKIKYPKRGELEFHNLPMVDCPNGTPITGKVSRGQNASFVIYGMCEVANYILDGYAHIDTVNKALWDAGRATIFAGSSNPDNHRIFLELMTAGSVNYNSIAEKAAHNSFLMQHFAYKALHGNNISRKDMRKMKEILCEFESPGGCLKTEEWIDKETGPDFDCYTSFANAGGWAMERWKRGATNYGNAILSAHGQFGVKRNGIDFMLAHNLYRLVKHNLETFAESNVRLGPNPTNAALFLTVERGHFQEYSIADVMGKTWQTGNIMADETTVELDVSSFVPGVYFMRLQGENGRRKTVKFVVSN